MNLRLAAIVTGIGAGTVGAAALLHRQHATRQAVAAASWPAWKERVMSFYQWDTANDPDVYTKICTGVSREEFEELADSIAWRLEPSRDQVLLDVGCGAGRLEKFIAPLVKELHAVDFAASMIDVARQRLVGVNNCHFWLNDGETLPMIASNSIDGAWAELVFIHVPKPVIASYVQEVYRVLKPGGRFICQIARPEGYAHVATPDIVGYMSRPEVEELFRPYGRVEFLEDPAFAGTHLHLVLATK